MICTIILDTIIVSKPKYIDPSSTTIKDYEAVIEVNINH